MTVSTGASRQQLTQQRSHSPRPCEERLLHPHPHHPTPASRGGHRGRQMPGHSAGWRGKQQPTDRDDQGACDCVPRSLPGPSPLSGHLRSLRREGWDAWAQLLSGQVVNGHLLTAKGP